MDVYRNYFLGFNSCGVIKYKKENHMALGISPMNMISYHWQILQKGKRNFYNP